MNFLLPFIIEEINKLLQEAIIISFHSLIEPWQIHKSYEGADEIFLNRELGEDMPSHS